MSQARTITSKKIDISVGCALLIRIDTICNHIRQNIRDLPDDVSLDKETIALLERLGDDPLFRHDVKKRKSATLALNSDSLRQLKQNLAQLNKLKELYLSGADTPEALADIEKELAELKGSSYEVRKDFEATTTDPTRRYFETHLSLACLKHNISKLALSDLQSLHDALYNRLNLRTHRHYDAVFKLKDSNFTGDDVEIIDIINKIGEIESRDSKNNPSSKPSTYYQEFSEENRSKLIVLAKITHLFVILIVTDKTIPLAEVFTEGFFEVKRRGRLYKDPVEKTSSCSHNMGLLQSSMRISSSDPAYSPEIYPYTKPVDKSEAIYDSDWVKHMAAKLVHPFSTSISGHFLALIRILISEKDNKKITLFEQEKMKYFIQFYCSLLLAHAGGHSLYEFIAPLKLEKIIKNLGFIKGLKSLDLNYIFLHGNEMAFSEALLNTLTYNRHILQWNSALQQIAGYGLHRAISEAKEAKKIKPEQVVELEVLLTDPKVASLVQNDILTVEQLLDTPHLDELATYYSYPYVKAAIHNLVDLILLINAEDDRDDNQPLYDAIFRSVQTKNAKLFKLLLQWYPDCVKKLIAKESTSTRDNLYWFAAESGGLKLFMLMDYYGENLDISHKSAALVSAAKNGDFRVADYLFESFDEFLKTGLFREIEVLFNEMANTSNWLQENLSEFQILICYLGKSTLHDDYWYQRFEVLAEKLGSSLNLLVLDFAAKQHNLLLLELLSERIFKTKDNGLLDKIGVHLRQLYKSATDQQKFHQFYAKFIELAVYNGDANVFEFILSRINFAVPINRYGQNCLILAAELGHIDMVKMLLTKTSSLDLTDSGGQTALIAAAKNNHPQVAALLLACGAKLEITDITGKTALMWAEAAKYTRVVEILNRPMKFLAEAKKTRVIKYVAPEKNKRIIGKQEIGAQEKKSHDEKKNQVKPEVFSEIMCLEPKKLTDNFTQNPDMNMPVLKEEVNPVQALVSRQQKNGFLDKQTCTNLTTTAPERPTPTFSSPT